MSSFDTPSDEPAAGAPSDSGADGPSGGHGRLMDAVYRQQRHIYDLTRKYYLFGRDRLIATLNVPAGGSVLEVGCGTGRNLVLAARAYPEATLYGFDISSVMLETAEKTIRKRGLEARIHLALGDATDFDAESLFGEAGFDRVYLSYAISMIPDWKEAVRQAYAAVAPGGELHIVDFGDQAAYPAPFRRLLKAWLALFHVDPRLELEAAVREVAGEEAHQDAGGASFTPLYGGYAFAAVLKKPALA